MAEVTLRPLKPSDLDRVMEMERLCFSLPWSREEMQSELDNPVARYYALEEDGVLVAYAGVWLAVFEGHITNVAVHPDHRKKGYGLRICEHLMRQALDLGAQYFLLEVRQGNLAAQQLYRKLGFKRAGIQEGYYTDTGEDAYIYVCMRPILALNRLKMQRG